MNNLLKVKAVYYRDSWTEAVLAQHVAKHRLAINQIILSVIILAFFLFGLTAVWYFAQHC